MLACAGSGAVMAGGRGATTQLGVAAFADMVNDTFLIYDNVRGVSVQLVKVRKAKAEPGMQQFTLTFAGSDADALAGGTYEVEHPAIGKMPMYLDVSRRGQHGMLYRADFNLLG